jgi:uncharacterized protein YuzE
MKITYDKDVDAAYIYLVDIDGGDVKQTKSVSCDGAVGFGVINFDFNDDGRIIGIEVLSASNILPVGLLCQETEGLEERPR